MSSERCGSCRHWFDIDAERMCPRLSKAKAQALGYISTGKPGKQLPTKSFDGTGTWSEACQTFLNVSESPSVQMVE